jgi:hypothetical protein
VRASIPRAFDDVLLRAMHRDPLHRYPTMQAFGSSLLGFASRRSWHVWSEQFAGASPDPSLSERTTDETLAAARPKPRRVVRASVLLAIAIALLSCGVSALVRQASAVAPRAQASSAPSAPPRPVESAAASISVPVIPAAAVPPAPVVPASTHAAHPAPSHSAPNVVAGTPAERGSNGVAILE